jgi:hypothetical protein
MNNKIELNYTISDNVINMKTMKPIYSTNTELMCGVIEYNGRTYYLDFEDKDNILNSTKSFVFANEYDIYPSYPINYKRVSYLEFMYNLNSNENNYYSFKNGNIYDLRRSNVQVSHFYEEKIIKQHNKSDSEVEYIEGHYSKLGSQAGIMKNPMWRIYEDEKEYLLMYCEKDTICKLCPESYQKIIDFEIHHNEGKKLTWFKTTNGYIQSHSKNSKVYFIHQIITGCYGNGKGTKNISVDHIDRDPLNNSMNNLRIATRKEQEANCKGIIDGTKRERKKPAKPLPEGLTQDMMRKYVVYYHEILKEGNLDYREFFKVEKHPKLDKIWVGTKSGKVDIFKKLAAANKIVDDLEKDIYPDKEYVFPTYISFVNRIKPFLSFDKKDEITGKRLNMKMLLPESYDMSDQLEIFINKIKEKYPDMTFDK